MRSKSVLALVTLLSACDVAGTPKKEDTTVALTNHRAADSAIARAPVPPGGVTAVPADSAAGLHAITDTGIVTFFPGQPAQGGILVAFAQGVQPEIPRCTWRGSPLACYRAGTGVLALVPLSADDAAGVSTLTIDRPSGGPITRQVTVASSQFGREIVLLKTDKAALLKNGGDITREARTLREMVSGESPTQRWSAAWRPPVMGKSDGYGVSRFYYRATDSSRAIKLDSAGNVRGAFGADTVALASGELAAWRHTGVDIAAPKRAYVTAPSAGVAEQAGSYTLTGNTLLIDHGQGVHSAYFHLDTVLVKPGDVIRAGQRIGRVGSTGLATGPHLHFAVYLHGRDVDPTAWFDASRQSLTIIRQSSTTGR
ncbi:MAG: M23 family metallopeptidase [Gemmatimonadaceae bacterium]